MSESLTRQLKFTKHAVRGKGVVVAQNVKAAEVGAEILRKGGNAIDAAVATGMAIGALEPWMSGMIAPPTIIMTSNELPWLVSLPRPRIERLKMFDHMIELNKPMPMIDQRANSPFVHIENAVRAIATRANSPTIFPGFERPRTKNAKLMTTMPM